MHPLDHLVAEAFGAAMEGFDERSRPCDFRRARRERLMAWRDLVGVNQALAVETEAAPLSRERVLQRAAHARERFDAREMRLKRIRDARRVSRADAADASGHERISTEGRRRPDETADVPSPVPLPQAGEGKGAKAPITRNAVLEAIARGKARRDALKTRSS